MSFDDLGMWAAILLVCGTFAVGGIFAGRRIERAEWHRLLPQQFEEICAECAGFK